ncbi:MAG: hypothetical protein ACOY4R_20575 [Pseudomonadota bacterium]
MKTILSSPSRLILATAGLAGMALAGCTPDGYGPYYGPSQGYVYPSSGYGYQPAGYYAPRPYYQQPSYGYSAPYPPYSQGPSITFNLPAGTVP